MATYNRAHLIADTLESISNQTFRNWECLIVDDRSIDNTERIVSTITKEDSRFKYLKRTHKHLKGLPGCRNFGIEKALGKYIIFFDDDDIIHPMNLEVCYSLLEDKRVDFCHFKKQSFVEEIPDFHSISESILQFQIGKSEIEKVIINQIALASCTVLWRRECFENIRFEESLNYAEEWECYSRILLAGFEGIGINEILYFNRKHPDSNTGEFWKGDKSRRQSYEKAIKLVIDNLKNKGLLSKSLVRYIVQMSILLKSKSILKYILSKSNIRLTGKLRYHFLYRFYPVIIQGYRFKKLLKN